MQSPKSKRLNEIKKSPYSFISLITCIVLMCSGCIDIKRNEKEPTPTYDLPDEMMDKSYMTGEPCYFPCWQNLCVGESTVDDVFTTVKTLPFVDAAETHEEDLYYSFEFDKGHTSEELLDGNGYRFNCKSSDIDCLIVKFRETGILHEIVIVPNYYLSYRDFVNVYGEPDYFYNLSLDPINCEVRLVWLKKSISIVSVMNTHVTGYDVCKYIEMNDNKVDSDFPVEYIEIEVPDYYTNGIKRDSNFIAWSGFIDD